jgi:Ca2+-binding RTX toxin-like protein
MEAVPLPLELLMRCLPWVPPALLLTILLVLPSSAVPAAPPACDGRTATIVGSDGPDRITGTDKADVIAGLGGDDLIDGLRGDDLICGGPGADRLLGGRGDDDLHGGLDKLADGPAGTYLLGDVLTGGPGDDLLVGGIDQRRADMRRRPDTFSYADSAARVVVDLSGRTTPGTGTATGMGSDTIVLGLTHGVIGSPQGDRITGSRLRDRIDGGAGNDTIDAGDGSDLIYPDGLGGSDGNDVVEAGPGDDLVNSRTGRDRISTGRGEDFVEAFSELPTKVELGLGDDYLGQVITPGRGASALGGLGDDVVAFYARLIGGQKPAARFTVDQRAGTTYASGSVEARGTIGGFEGHRLIGPVPWTFLGGPSADRVWAITGGPLTARGADGPDQLRGTELADLLDGGSGTDTGHGEGGKDTCRSIERGDC